MSSAVEPSVAATIALFQAFFKLMPLQVSYLSRKGITRLKVVRGAGTQLARLELESVDGELLASLQRDELPRPFAPEWKLFVSPTAKVDFLHKELAGLLGTVVVSDAGFRAKPMNL